MQDRNVKIQTIAIPVIAIMVVTLFFYYAEPILVPVVIGITLAFILNPAVRLLRRAKLPHVVAVVVVMFLALIIFLSIAALIAAQTGELVVQLPGYWAGFKAQLENLLERFPSLAQYLPGALPEDSAGLLENVKWNDMASVSKFLFAGLGSAFALLWKMILILLITTFILVEQEGFKRKLANIFGKEQSGAANAIVDQISSNISGFLSVRFLTTAGLGVVVTIVLLIMGVPYAYVWGPLAGLLNLIPYIGAILGAIPPMIVASIENESMWWLLYVGIFFFILQFLEGNIITPKLVGNRVNLNLTSVLISTLYWGWLWGGVGVILAMPITAAIKVICDHIEPLRPIGSLLDGDSGV
jgi:predicted PurR-regulated permease PerM